MLFSWIDTWHTPKCVIKVQTRVFNLLLRQNFKVLFLGLNPITWDFSNTGSKTYTEFKYHIHEDRKPDLNNFDTSTILKHCFACLFYIWASSSWNIAGWVTLLLQRNVFEMLLLNRFMFSQKHFMQIGLKLHLLFALAYIII